MCWWPTKREEVAGVLQHSLAQLPVSVQRVAQTSPKTGTDHFMDAAVELFQPTQGRAQSAQSPRRLHLQPQDMCSNNYYTLI